MLQADRAVFIHLRTVDGDFNSICRWFMFAIGDTKDDFAGFTELQFGGIAFGFMGFGTQNVEFGEPLADLRIGDCVNERSDCCHDAEGEDDGEGFIQSTAFELRFSQGKGKPELFFLRQFPPSEPGYT